MKLVLEVRGQKDKTGKILGGRGMVTPIVDETYWQYRVKVSERQAVLGFPKFNTIGIGFAIEKDWNTNLPFACSTAEIYNHIKHNRLDAEKADCLKAIRMVQAACGRA